MPCRVPVPFTSTETAPSTISVGMRCAYLLPAIAFALSCSPAASQASSTDEINRALGRDNLGRQNLLPLTGGTGQSSGRSALPAPARRAAESRDIIYLSQLLAGPDQRFAYNQLFGRIGTPPTWVRRFNETGEARQVPVHLARYKGEQYQFARICSPTAEADCLTIVFNYNPVASALAFYSQGDVGAWALPPYDIGLAEFLEKKINAPAFWQ